MNENSTTTRTRPGTAGKVGAIINIIASIMFVISLSVGSAIIKWIFGDVSWLTWIIIIILIFTIITNLLFFISGSNKALAGILGLISAGIIGGLLVLIDKGSN